MNDANSTEEHLLKLADEINEQTYIDEIYPKNSDILLNPLNNETSPVLDDIQYIIFPVGKLMWPVRLESHPKQPNVNVVVRSEMVRSTTEKMYTIDKIYSISNNEKGSWIFVSHQHHIGGELRLLGFVTTLRNVTLKEYGNTPPLTVSEWVSKNKDRI